MALTAREICHLTKQLTNQPTSAPSPEAAAVLFRKALAKFFASETDRSCFAAEVLGAPSVTTAMATLIDAVEGC